MISYHGYQNYLAPPTSEPSRDRYIQPPKIKPTSPCSPDDVLHAHIISWPVKQISQLGNCRIFNNFSLSKKTSKTMEEGGPSFEKFFSETCRHVIAFLKSEKWHIGVIPHHHTIMGTKGEGQGRGGRSMEVGGGDLGGG